MKRKVLFLFLAFSVILVSCKKKYELGDPPTSADAGFSHSHSPTSNNIIVFKTDRSDVRAVWDFGNNTTGEGTTAEGRYPYKGTYIVKLTVFTSGGSTSSSQEIVIPEDDLSLIDDPIIEILTGGIDGSGSRSWVVNSVADDHFGVGPDPIGSAGYFPEYYSAAANEKDGAAFYDDVYTFHLNAFKFDMVTNGEVYVNAEEKDNFPGAYESPVSDYNAPYTDRLDKSWSTREEEGKTFISIVPDAFIGYFTGTYEYEIVTAKENELFLRQLDANNSDLAWYIRLVPEGMNVGDTSGGGGTDPVDTNKFELPIDFETIKPIFEGFGGSTDTIIPNPDASGINTSATVLETVHGNETWAGIFVDMKTTLDFSTNNSISVKVYAPGPGTFRIKLEDSNNSNRFVEKDATYTQTNTWEEISIDFSGESGKYDRIALFPGWNVPNAGTFYIDDIIQK